MRNMSKIALHFTTKQCFYLRIFSFEFTRLDNVVNTLNYAGLVWMRATLRVQRSFIQFTFIPRPKHFVCALSSVGTDNSIYLKIFLYPKHLKCALCGQWRENLFTKTICCWESADDLFNSQLFRHKTLWMRALLRVKM